MDLGQLEYFLAVAEHGGFSKAARTLGITQPSLSEQIRKLETTLRRPLFDRLPRGVVLTEAGRVLAGHARQLLADADAARREVTDAGGRVCGVLRVGAIPTIAPFLLPQVIRTFSAKFPEVRTSIVEEVTSRLLPAVEDGAVDLAILSDATPPSTVSIETLGRERLLAALPATHALAKSESLRGSQFDGHCVLVLKEMHCLAQQVAGLCKLRTTGETVTLQGEQLFTIAAMIEAGLGLSVVPAMMARSVRRPRIVYRPLVGDAIDRPINVATSLLRHRSNAARAFLDVLRPACAALCES